MTVYAAEQVLYDLGVKRDARKAFAEDADVFLERYRLSAAERAMVKGFEVRALFDAGVNPMLTLGFWQMCEPSHSMSGYMKRMRANGG